MSDKTTGRIPAFDYLRSLGVLLVLLNHTVIGYATFGFTNPDRPAKTFSPIVDSSQWVGFDVIALLNDLFFMPLLFFVSGLFVWQGLRRRGAAGFLLGRLTRLGIPFIVGIAVLMPVAYYPAVLQAEMLHGQGQGFGAFWLDWVRHGFDQPGPMWFIWMLLAFDGLAALLYSLLGKARSKPGPVAVLDSSLLFAVMLIALSLAAYIPMRAVFDKSLWLGVGPFQLQISRLFLYLVYFGVAVAVGARGVERTAFRSGGGFARRWWVWQNVGILAYVGLLVTFGVAPQSPTLKYQFVFMMALVVVSIVATFVRFVRRNVPILDSLSANTYGIYITHYLAVIWLQYALLGVDLAAIPKAAIVFCGSLALCWGATAALRRIPAVARVV